IPRRLRRLPHPVPPPVPRRDLAMSLFTEPLSRGHWAVRGLLAVALGGALLVWPSIPIGTVVVLFAFYAFADAIASVTRVFRSGAGGGERAMRLVRAAIEVSAGVVAI